MPGLLVWLACASLALGVPRPAAAEPPADDLVAFDRGFREGQEQFNHGEYLPAARTWAAAATRLHESPDNKDNRAAVHDYIAEAYRKSVRNGAGEDIVREGLAVLSAYADEFAAAYPGETASPQVIAARDEFRAKLAAAEAARRPVEAPVEAPPVEASRPVEAPPPAKPWKPLTIAGGAVLGVGVATLGLFVGGLVRARQTERQYDDPRYDCPPSNPTGSCAEIDRYGRSMSTVATVSLIAAPLLLGAGAAMLAIGLKRRAAGNVSVAPLLGPRSAGLVWELRF